MAGQYGASLSSPGPRNQKTVVLILQGTVLTFVSNATDSIRYLKPHSTSQVAFSTEPVNKEGNVIHLCQPCLCVVGGLCCSGGDAFSVQYRSAALRRGRVPARRGTRGRDEIRQCVAFTMLIVSVLHTGNECRGVTGIPRPVIGIGIRTTRDPLSWSRSLPPLTV